MNGPNGPSYSAYITYSTPEESSLAILALDNSVIEGHVLRASYGTTKYCANYLRGAECFNKECLYLHALADESDIIDRVYIIINKYLSCFYLLKFRMT
jgi:CCR4-NOT transcription complex subunit 4